MRLGSIVVAPIDGDGGVPGDSLEWWLDFASAMEKVSLEDSDSEEPLPASVQGIPKAIKKHIEEKAQEKEKGKIQKTGKKNETTKTKKPQTKNVKSKVLPKKPETKGKKNNNKVKSKVQRKLTKITDANPNIFQRLL